MEDEGRHAVKRGEFFLLPGRSAGTRQDSRRAVHAGRRLASCQLCLLQLLLQRAVATREAKQLTSATVAACPDGQRRQQTAKGQEQKPYLAGCSPALAA